MQILPEFLLATVALVAGSSAASTMVVHYVPCVKEYKNSSSPQFLMNMEGSEQIEGLNSLATIVAIASTPVHQLRNQPSEGLSSLASRVRPHLSEGLSSF